MKPKNKIALFGGSFDPIHIGHVSLIEKAIELFQFDQLIVIPCKQSPHKENAPQASDSHRLKMCELATKHLPAVTVSDIEVHRNPPSYSWMTVEAYRTLFPHSELFWIMGTDQWNNLEKWARFDYLAESLHFIVVERQETISSKTNIKHSPLHFDAKISSTEIRNQLNSSQTATHLPGNVEHYILRNKLYST